MLRQESAMPAPKTAPAAAQIPRSFAPTPVAQRWLGGDWSSWRQWNKEKERLSLQQLRNKDSLGKLQPFNDMTKGQEPEYDVKMGIKGIQPGYLTRVPLRRCTSLGPKSTPESHFSCKLPFRLAGQHSFLLVSRKIRGKFKRLEIQPLHQKPIQNIESYIIIFHKDRRS